MDIERRLLDIERKLWTNDPVFYENNLIEEALLVFPETGVITRAVALDAIRQENAEGRRWAEVEFNDVRTVQPTDSTCLLTYTVTARWEHEQSKVVALASSVYIQRDGVWGKSAPGLEKILADFSAKGGSKVSDVQRAAQGGIDSLSFSVSGPKTSAHMRYIKTKSATYSLSVEFPNAHRDDVARIREEFFGSFKTNARGR